MPYIQGEGREQLTLMPVCLDDYIDRDNICRVIAAYVGSLDLASLGFKRGQRNDIGRPSYNPSSMLMLYLYGYLNRIRSSRRLEAETQRNLEVMWLMEKLMPDDKTISNFRKDNAAALKRVFREFSLWCNRNDLYGKELVAVDGSKIRANCSRDNIHTKKEVEKELATVEKKISEYMNELEVNDVLATEEEHLSQQVIRSLLQRFDEKKATLEDYLEKITASDCNEISTVDPDAHIMRQGGEGRMYDACYNVQSVVDAKHKLVVDFEVSTCAIDKGSLSIMTESAKEIMGVEKISVAGDKGYYDGGDIEKCEKSGTRCYVPKIEGYSPAPDSKFNYENFRYNRETDSYVCPNGETLLFKKYKKRPNGEYGRVYLNAEACKECSNREQCTKQKRGREIFRNPHQDALDTVDARMLTNEAGEILRERKKIVEHPFGTIKHIWGYRQFLCRGHENTAAEQSLVFLAYNFRRVFNIFKENGMNLIDVMA